MKRGMKKRGAFLLSLAMVLSLIGVGPVGSKNALAANKIQLAKNKITVEVKESKKIKIENIKKNQVEKLTVKSKKTSVAKAKKVGKTEIKVTGKKKGITKVTVHLKLKKKVAGKKKYKFTLDVNVKKTSTSTPTPKPIPRYTTEPTLPIADIKVNTVHLPDMTYYLGQTSPSPLDASGTTGSVASTGETSRENITFQWFAGESKGEEEAVKDATEKTYTPDISKVGTSYVYYTANFVPKDKIIGATGVSNTATITVLEKVPITFDANGGTFIDADKAKKEVTWGETLGATPSESDMTAPTSGTNGTDFLGWATTNTATYGDVYSSTKITQAATYYAVWGTRPPETPYVPPAPPSAEIPQNVTISLVTDDSGGTDLEYDDVGGLICNCTVRGESSLTYQWFYTLNGEAQEPITTNEKVLISDWLGDLIGSGGTIYVRVINSPSGYSASTSIPSATYAFVTFKSMDGEIMTVGDVNKDSVVLLRETGSTLNIDEAPTIQKDSCDFSGWGAYEAQNPTLDSEHSIRVDHSMQLYAVWRNAQP